MKIIKHLGHSVIPVFIGGMIYIIYRPDSLIMFNWFKSLGLLNYINELRKSFNYPISQLVIYNLPNGFWCYSITYLMIVIWKNKITKQSFLWIFSGLFIGIFTEFAQLFHFIKGTFDFVDIIVMLVFSIIGFLHLNTKNHDYKAQIITT